MSLLVAASSVQILSKKLIDRPINGCLLIKVGNGVSLPPCSAYMQSFNFRSVVLPEISFDEKSVSVSQPATQLAQFDVAEPQLC